MLYVLLSTLSTLASQKNKASDDSPAAMAESVATESVAIESVATASNAELAERADTEADQKEEVLRLLKNVAELQKELQQRDGVDASPTKRNLNDADASPTKRAQTGMLSASSPTTKNHSETTISALATTFALAHTCAWQNGGRQSQACFH